MHGNYRAYVTVAVARSVDVTNREEWVRYQADTGDFVPLESVASLVITDVIQHRQTKERFVVLLVGGTGRATAVAMNKITPENMAEWTFVQ